MSITGITPLLRIQLNQRINAHNSHASLDGTLQLLNLAHTGLENTGLETVLHLAVRQVQAVVFVIPRLSRGLVVSLLLLAGLLGRRGGLREPVGGRCLGWRVRVRGVFGCRALGEGVAATKLGCELGGVFGGVDGEGVGDGEERGCEGAYGKLFAGALDDMC